MTFSINEKTQYIKPVVSVENVYGRDIQLDKTDRDINVENGFFPKFGQDRKITGQVPTAQGVPRLYYNLNDRLIASTDNNCVYLESPEKIWAREDHSRFTPTNFPNIPKDPRYNLVYENTRTNSYNYNFTQVHRRKQ